jgi:hypothetical protein
MSTETARLKDGRSVKFVPEPIGDGAMKEVFFTEDRSSVVCFYKDPAAANDTVRMRRLDAILGRFNPTVLRDAGGAAYVPTEAAYFQNLFCWPTGIVTSPRFGILTPAFPSNYFFASGPDFIRGREKNGMRFIGRKNRRLLEEHAPAELGDWRNYLALCIRLARAVTRLHMTGLAHSDLSPNNALVDPTTGTSCVIDIDSLVVPGVFPPDVMGTKGYIAPEVLKTIHLPADSPSRKHPDVRTDQHALAVLVYQYLLRRHPLEGRRIPPARTAEEQDLLSFGEQALFCEHPQDDSNRPLEPNFVPCTSLGNYLKDLFYRAFTKGLHLSEERPAATEWQGGLLKTWDLLRPCDNKCCPAGWFVVTDARRATCPFCKAKPKGRTPILRLCREVGSDLLVPERDLVVYHNLQIFKWHAYDIGLPGPETDHTPQAYCVFHEGRWLLVNQALDTLTSPGGNRVGPGHAIDLADGARFRFSNRPGGRVAEVSLA